MNEDSSVTELSLNFPLNISSVTWNILSRIPRPNTSQYIIINVMFNIRRRQMFETLYEMPKIILLLGLFTLYNSLPPSRLKSRAARHRLIGYLIRH
jgi:hypothetical protein